MTEDELFKAVHAYAAHLDDHGPDLTEREARDALLEAIEAYAGDQLALKTRALDDCEAQLVVYDKLASGFALLKAKAAVCDRVLAAAPDVGEDLWSYDRLESKGERDELTAAVAAVRELESK